MFSHAGSGGGGGGAQGLCSAMQVVVSTGCVVVSVVSGQCWVCGRLCGQWSVLDVWSSLWRLCSSQCWCPHCLWEETAQ